MTTIASTEKEGHEVPGPRTITVHGSAAGFAQEIAIGQHRLAADEPLSVGGADTGPRPYEEQRARLLDIATKCPVHRTLESEIVIETHMSEVGISGMPTA